MGDFRDCHNPLIDLVLEKGSTVVRETTTQTDRERAGDGSLLDLPFFPETGGNIRTFFLERIGHAFFLFSPIISFSILFTGVIGIIGYTPVIHRLYTGYTPVIHRCRTNEFKKVHSFPTEFYFLNPFYDFDLIRRFPRRWRDARK